MRTLGTGVTSQNRASPGFTLIETCIVIAIGGLALSAGIDLVKQYRASQVVKVNNERIATIKKALVGYIGKNNRLPCAAPRNLPSTDANYGRALADCAVADPGTARVPGARVLVPPQTVRIGAVPVRDLGLPNSYIADAWGRQFTYAVTEGVTVGPFNSNLGAIEILNPVSAVSEVDPPASVLYTVFSSGKDGNGAWSREGAQTPCNAAVLGHDTANCLNATAVFVSAPFSTAETADHFDDQMVYSNTVNTLDLPVCTAAEVLTSLDGETFTCQPFPPPPPPPEACGANERLTSTDGITFSCLALPLPPPPPPPPEVCGAGEILTSDGTNYICTAIPPAPAALVLPVCGPGTVLSADGANYVCTPSSLKILEVTCDGVKTSSTTPAYICQANCPSGYRVLGGGFIWNGIRSDNSKTFEQQGTNGFKCSVVMEQAQYELCGGCGMKCSATCGRME